MSVSSGSRRRGEAPLDLWPVDIRRFSTLHRDRDWVRDRTLEAYGKHYTVAFPHEEYTSGRPRITSPLYPRLKAAGAIPVGKTNLPEFGSTAFTKNRLFGVTRNPWNLARTPGGQLTQ